MPTIDFGEKLPWEKGGSKIFKLTAKGEQTVVRILDKAHYVGRHFIERKDGKWTIFLCPRIMQNKNCFYCQMFFENKKLAKEAKEKGDKAAAEALEKEAAKTRPSIKFYFPALLRDKKEVVLLEVPLSIRIKLENFAAAGIDILNSDFVYTRTGKPGSDYYTLIRKDSSEVKPLSKEERELIEGIKEWDIDRMIGTSKESSLSLKEGEGTKENGDGLYEAAREIFGEGKK